MKCFCFLSLCCFVSVLSGCSSLDQTPKFYQQISSYILQPNDMGKLDILQEKRKQALELQKQRDQLLAEIRELEHILEAEKKLSEERRLGDNSEAQVTGNVETATSKPDLGQSCPVVFVSDEQVGQYGSDKIQSRIQIDYNALAKEKFMPGQTIVFIQDHQEIFITYTKNANQHNVACREYEIVTTIDGEPVMDMETVCENNGVWRHPVTVSTRRLEPFRWL